MTKNLTLSLQAQDELNLEVSRQMDTAMKRASNRDFETAMVIVSHAAQKIESSRGRVNPGELRQAIETYQKRVGEVEKVYADAGHPYSPPRVI